MNTLQKSLLSGLTALSLGAAFGVQAQTQAQTQPQTQPQARQHQQLTPEQRQARRAEFMAGREAKLHDALGITPAQENAWTSFVAAMKPAAHAQFDRAAWTGLSAPQRAQKMLDMQKQHTAAMEQRLSALNTFYAVLTPQQKQVMDSEAARMGRHRFGHGQGMHGDWQNRGAARG